HQHLRRGTLYFRGLSALLFLNGGVVTGSVNALPGHLHTPLFGGDETAVSTIRGCTMKKLRLLVGFYRRNWISCLVLTSILTFALFQMAGFLGTVRYMNYAKSFWKDSQVGNSLYYMPTAFESEDPRSGVAKFDLEA